ncbi:hypothetical protein HNY73_017413 [Argiope bruennichi]|uniref:Peptidase aspartic putative domain-containing protein n=1 Tax=Argiope bruennichi TaxID=94029 RepID=A0A8T0EDK7_ARGBR|nr:hypothetical protein HNY73_017413 [Argiope bruennichi]
MLLYHLPPPPTTFNVNIKSTSRPKKKNNTPFCAFCETSGHWAQKCETITSYDTRIQKLKYSNLCTNRGRRMSNCSREDTVCCKKKHHVSICPPAQKNQLVITNSNINHINFPKTIFTHLQTARLYVTGPTDVTKLTCCILDGGSQASFVDTNLIKTLKLKVMSSDTLNCQAFESTTTRDQRRCVQLSVSSLWSKQRVSSTAFESFNTYPTVPTELFHFARKRRLTLVDPPDDSSLPIELLVGGDKSLLRKPQSSFQNLSSWFHQCLAEFSVDQEHILQSLKIHLFITFLTRLNLLPK